MFGFSFKFNKNQVLVSSGILLLGLVMAVGNGLKWANDEDRALHDYRTDRIKNVTLIKSEVQTKLESVYQGLRSIANLPNIRTIDRYGKNLGPTDQESIIQIYNFLHSSVSISEIYIVPGSFEPEKIDPTTGSLEEPILMFDDAVAAHEEGEANGEPEKYTTTAEAMAKEEVEIYEYRYLKTQIAMFKKNYATLNSFPDMHPPILASTALLTCDNSEFDQTHNDIDRTGIILSIPFYGPDGNFKGTVSAVVRLNILAAMLPKIGGDGGYALVNQNYNLAILSDGFKPSPSLLHHINSAQADPARLVSVVDSIKLNDPTGDWNLWVGEDDSIYYQTIGYKMVILNRWVGYGLVVFLTLIGLIGYYFSQKSLRAVEIKNREISEQAKATQDLMTEQLKQKDKESERHDKLLSLTGDFEVSIQSMVTQVVSAAEQMVSGSNSLNQVASMTLQQSQGVSDASQTAADTSVKVQVAAEELAASIRDIRDQAVKSHVVTEKATQQTKITSQLMSELASETSQIGEILTFINGIARQINLLSLNATIEAARAGEAGKSFAVVASEIKQLADQVNQATDKISQNIGTIQDASEKSVKAVSIVEEIIGQVRQHVEAVASAVEEQSAVTQEITAHIATTVTNAKDISVRIEDLTQGAATTGSTADQVLQSANGLHSSSADLQKQVTEFLKNVLHV